MLKPLGKFTQFEGMIVNLKAALHDIGINLLVRLASNAQMPVIGIVHDRGCRLLWQDA